MGYMVHHAILVTTFDEQAAKVAHKKASEIFDRLVSGITGISESLVNGYHSFAIFPDGSKDGWEDSDEGDEHRAAFVAWLETQQYEDRSSRYDWVEVQYGDDNGKTMIINDSDAWQRSNNAKL